MVLTKISSSAKQLSLPGDFRFYGLLGFNGEFLIFDFIEFSKSLNEIVTYDTYIMFEIHSGAMLFAKNISKNKNIFEA